MRFVFNSSVCPLSEDLQNVNITLRILFRPVASQLPRIFTSIGEDYDERVLPSITTEILKSVVVSGRGCSLEQHGPQETSRRQEELGIGGVGKWLVASWVLSCFLFILMGSSALPRSQARFDAGELITQRELVSRQVSDDLTERAATFGLILDDVSLVRSLGSLQGGACLPLCQRGDSKAWKLLGSMRPSPRVCFQSRVL